MALQATGQGSRPPVTAAAANDQDPAQRLVSLCGTGCPKRAAAGFPDDAIVDILSHLPAKPLFRFKCVSKAWCELIANRFRYSKLPKTLEGFFYGCVDDFSSEGCRDFSSADSDESGNESSSEDTDESGSEDSDKGGSDDANGGASAGGDEGEVECSSKDEEGECSIKDEKLPQHIHGHFINLSGISVPLVDPLFSSLRKQPGIRSLTLLDSCNGLLLFGHIQDPDLCDTRSYIVYNPATEHWVPVPSSGFKLILIGTSGGSQDEDSDDDYLNSWVLTSCVSTHLIFDPVASSHFQLIEFGNNPDVAAVRIYSSETRKWDNRARGRIRWEKRASWNLSKTIKSMRGSTIFNKMLHLIVRPTSIGPELIAAIDGKGETCKIISWLGNRGFPIFLGQSKGLLHCFSVSGHPDGNSCHMTELSIWVLKEYDAEEWELKHTVSFLELFGKQSCQFGSDYNVATLHPEYNLIFFVQHWDYKLVSYDMDCKELHDLCTVGCDYGLIAPYVPYFSETPVLSKKAQSKKALCNCFQLGYICKD